MFIAQIAVEDLEALAALYFELTEVQTDLLAMCKSFEMISENEDYLLVGAKDENGRLLGSLLGIVCTDVVGECRPFLVLENVIVSSEARGRGVGKLLMESIEGFARERGCSYIILVSGAKRTGAHAFYEALGYAEHPARGFKKILK